MPPGRLAGLTECGADTRNVALAVAALLPVPPLSPLSGAVPAVAWLAAPAGTVKPSVPELGTAWAVKATLRVLPLPELVTVAVAPPVALVVVEWEIVDAPA